MNAAGQAVEPLPAEGRRRPLIVPVRQRRRSLRPALTLAAGAVLTGAGGALLAVNIRFGLVVLGVAVLATALHRDPEWLACMGMLCLIPFEMMERGYFLPGLLERLGMAGEDVATIRRYLLPMFFAPLVLRRGFRDHRIPWPVFAWPAMLLVTVVLLPRFPGWGITNGVGTMIERTMFWVVLGISLTAVSARRLLLTAAALPGCALVVATAYHVTGRTPMFDAEFGTGVNRLGGIMISAYWAAMALGALVACAVLVYRNWATRAAWPLLCLNVLVLAMAAGRGTIGAFFTCVVVPMFLVSARWASVRGRSAIVYRYALLVLVGLAIFAVVFPRVAARSGVETSTGQQAGLVNTSGRSQAWAYFLERTSESPWFGNGVGTVTVMVRADQTVNQGFVAAHNEYIQTYTEGGWFGLGLFLVLVLAMFARDFTKVVDPKLRMPLGFLLLGVGVYSITDNSQYVLFSLPFAIAYAAFMVPGHCERVVPPARARIRRRSRARSRLPMDAVMPERPGPAEPARPPAPVAA